MIINRMVWFVFIILTMVIGLYPFMYFVFDMSGGFPSVKPVELLQNKLWITGFYLHISFGGIALLAGFSQFSKRLRNWKLTLHRTLGKIYLISVAISGVSGLCIAMVAAGGIITTLGFSTAAIIWLFCTQKAYFAIRSGDIDKHQQWMLRSYSICWAAVTFRIWGPLLQYGLGMEFMDAYRIISWIGWAPNLLVAEIIIRTLNGKKIIRTERVFE
ncbi:DUF2306 domain-containing protein [bacterium]|nr:DUF2306 domain-containing protein [bacterium]